MTIQVTPSWNGCSQISYGRLRVTIVHNMQTHRPRTFSEFLKYLLLFPLAPLACSCEPIALAWSPNSNRIAAVGRATMDTRSVLVLSLLEVKVPSQGTAPIPVPALRALRDAVADDGFISVPAWSPDGMYLAYYRYQGAKTASTRPTGREEGPTRSAADHPPSIVDAELVVLRTDTREQRALRTVRWKARRSPPGALAPEAIPSPVWSKDSTCIFYASLRGAQDEYQVDGVSLKGMKKTIGMSSNDGRIWASVSRPTVAALSDGKIILNQLEPAKRWSVPIPGTLSRDVVEFSGDLRVAAFLGKDALIVIDVASGRTHAILQGGDVASTVGIALSGDGRNLYSLVRTRADLDPSKRSRCQVRRVDIGSKKESTLFTCPDVGQATMLSVSPDEKRIVVIMKHGPGSGKDGFSVIGDGGRVLMEIGS